MKCSVCAAENPEHASRCRECQSPFDLTCEWCRAAVLADSKFCGNCGKPLHGTPFPPTVPRQFNSPINYTSDRVAQKILNSRSTIEGERKQATVLFCDIVNSTPLTERLGPDAMHSLLQCFFELVLTQIHTYEGTVNKFLGDGFLALFGVPLAHEDHPRRAVYAALDIQKALAASQAESFFATGRNKEGPARDSSVQNALRTLQVRIGINTGLVVVGNIGDNLETEYTAIGDTMNVAARLQTVAEPGTIVVSENTYRATVDDCEYLPLGARAIKGKAEKVTVYRVLDRRKGPDLAVRAIGRTISSPVLGRSDEIQFFLRAIEQLLAGRGGVISISGEAGMGKSRLLLEVKRLAESENLHWLEGRARSLGRMLSYRPFQEIIRSDAGIQEDDDALASWEKLNIRISSLFGDTTVEVLPYLATLLNLDIKEDLQFKVKYLDAQALGHQIFRSVRLFFERLAQKKPLILLFEDIHWLDHSSARLLEHLLPLVETVPILVCLVSRPEQNLEPTSLVKIAADMLGDRCAAIKLAPLSPFDCGVLLRNLLKTDDLSPSLVELIARKAEGNPFFVEEVVRALIDVGGIIHDERTGAWHATQQANAITIPDSLQALIMSRIDRLTEDLKQALRTASVIGRNFLYRLLLAVEGENYSRPAMMEELERIELIRERSRIPDLEYSFKHALVQESAYESIVLQRRRELHKLVGHFMEELYTDRLDEFYGLIAYHYAKAGEWQQAQDYLIKAGDQAGEMAADAEALEHYRQAVTVFEQSGDEHWDPIQRAVIERKIGEALFRRGHHERALESLNQALVYLGDQRLPNSRRAIRFAIFRELIRQVSHRVLNGKWRESQRRKSGTVEEERGRIYEAMMWIDYFVDQERAGLDMLLLLNLSEDTGLARGEVSGCSGVGCICDMISQFSLAGCYHQRAVTKAEQIQDPVSIGHAYYFLGFHEHHLGNWRQALQHYEKAAASYRIAGHLRGWGAAVSCSNWLFVAQGNFTKTLEQAKEMVQIGQDAADSQIMGWGFAHLAKVLLVQGGALEDSCAYVKKALDIFKSIPDYHTVAALTAELGEFYLYGRNLREGLPILRESVQLIHQKSLRGLFLAWVPNMFAEGLLIEVRNAAQAQKQESMKAAKRACKEAVRTSKGIKEILMIANCLQGTYEWLNLKPAKAGKLWRSSLQAATELGARYMLGTIHLKIGAATGDVEHLKSARAIFSDIGDQLDLKRTQELLEGNLKKSSEQESVELS